MIKQLCKVGNSNALILDRAILELLGIEESAEVQLVVSGGSLIVTPTHPKPIDEARFQASLDRVMSERREALRRLAE